MHRIANEISRKILDHLSGKSEEGVRFRDLVENTGIEEKDLVKNLYWLEEHHLVRLSTILSAGATFPQVAKVRLSREGRDLVADPEKLACRFPVEEDGEPARAGTYEEVLTLMRSEIEASEKIKSKERNKALKAIDTLLGLSLAKDKIRY